MVIIDKELSELGKQKANLIRKLDKDSQNEELKRELKNLSEKIRYRQRKLIDNETSKIEDKPEGKKLNKKDEYKTALSEYSTLKASIRKNRTIRKEMRVKMKASKSPELKEEYKELKIEYKSLMVVLKENKKKKKELREAIKRDKQ